MHCSTEAFAIVVLDADTMVAVVVDNAGIDQMFGQPSSRLVH